MERSLHSGHLHRHREEITMPISFRIIGLSVLMLATMAATAFAV
jgi:hypothetical protein